MSGTIRSLFQPRTCLELRLVDELAHAQGHLDRLRRHQAELLQRLIAHGLDEVEASATLAESKHYRALRRDEVLYLQTWTRLSKLLQRVPQSAPEPEPAPEAAPLKEPLAMPRRDDAPRNALCPCGSGVKYKRCCLGQPLPRAA